MLNYKFSRGSRVIDLRAEYQMALNSASSSFVKESKMKRLEFDERLSHGEDAFFITKILLEKLTLGVVAEAAYYYRKRSAGAVSAVQGSEKSPKYYLPTLEFYHDAIIRYSVAKYGFLPNYVQFSLAYELQWRIKMESIPRGVLTPEAALEYRKRLHGLYIQLDDRIIAEQSFLCPERKAWILEQKHGEPMQLLKWHDDTLLTINNEAWFALSQNKTCLEFLKIRDGVCSLEGYTTIYPAHLKEVRIEADINGRRYSCEPVERNAVSRALGEPISFRQGFRISFPAARTDERYSIRFITRIGEFEAPCQNLAAGTFFPVSRQYESSYYVQENWKVSMDKGTVLLRSCGRKGQIADELAFLKELWRKNALGARKAVIGRLAYHVLKRLKRKEIWLISDRIVKADDNGEAFFRYIQQEHKGEINAYFVLSKDCEDYRRIKKVGPVVDNLSWKHKMLFLLCDYNISAQADGITIDPFPGYRDGVRDILSRGRFVFLQHGVIKDNLSGWLNRYNRNIAGFVTAAKPEYRSIIDGDYFYEEKRIWLTGLPRFDRRYHDEKKIITIMPTWRMYLLNASMDSNGQRALKEGFRESAYYLFYQGLLNSPELSAAAQRLGYQLALFIHPNMQPHLHEFNVVPTVKMLGIDTSYNEVYAQSSLVITDYSSAVFDFAYLRKPIVYCQFDAEEFFAGEHVCTRGYFDYERDGFGEVEHDLEGTVARIIEYMESGCRLKEKYRERIDKFFAFNDQNNCRRVYEKIMELDREEPR